MFINPELEQLIFNLSYGNEYHVENFIVAENNLYAYKLISSWPDTWGVEPYKNTILLIGPKYSGKTHLAHIWKYKADAIFIDSISQINSIYDKYSAFIIENIDYNWKELDLLYAFNWLSENNKFALLTMSSSTIDIYTIADLVSRLKSLVIVKINLPSQEQIQILLNRYFYKYNLMVSNQVVNYLSYVLPRNFSVIVRVFDMINKISMKKKQKITLPFVKNIIKDFFEKHKV